MDQSRLFIQDNIIPLKKYVGRKASSGVYQQILSRIPKCELFIEPMCGSGYISSKISNCSIVANDRDALVIKQISFPSDHITFSSEDYLSIIDRYDNGNKQRVFYFDPPYMMETRKQQISMFNYDWTKEDHVIFLKRITKMKCPVLVSQYPNDLYEKHLRKWRKIRYNSMTRKGVRMEYLYMNFPQPVLLQCYNHVGENFTDRQRIKRKVDRMFNRLSNEKPQERAAILSCIIEKFNYVNLTQKIE